MTFAIFIYLYLAIAIVVATYAWKVDKPIRTDIYDIITIIVIFIFWPGILSIVVTRWLTQSEEEE